MPQPVENQQTAAIASSEEGRGAPRLRAWFLVVAACWTILIAALATWDSWETRSAALAIVRAAARDSFQKDLIYRRWASAHGGVYVPITVQTPPNPHLAHISERDIITPSGKKLTLMNPAYMTRQVHELGNQQHGVRGHITSLKPIRPANAPDAWERDALLALERGEKEVSSLEMLGNERYLRLMRPLTTERGCLKCHATQGYKEGDIRGGISVSVPWGPSRRAILGHLPSSLAAYGGIWAIGMLGLCVFRSRVQRHLSNLHRAQQALKTSETRLRAITDSAQDAILMMDPQGTVSYWNPMAESLLGYRSDEAIGQDLHALLAPECYLEAHRQAFPEFVHTGRGNAVGKTVELAARRKDGQEIVIDLSLSATLLDGAWHAVGILRDVTERKQIERQREQYAAALENHRQVVEEFYEAAESATRAKSEFLANMSHEIRTPMTAILGYADLISESLDCCTVCPAHSTCEARLHNRTYMQTLRRNGDHLLEIINGILDLSKIEAGKLQVERIACAPADILSDVVSLMRVRADAKGLALMLDYAGPLPATISTDPTRLRQILINLVGNAIKFTKTGEVRIVVRLDGRDAPQPRLVCEIVDTGIGMTPQQLEDLFQPFHQADGSTSREFGGTGLGLAISKRLAELLGGDIRASSQVGKGSTFTLTVDPGPLSGVAFRDRPADSVAAPAPSHRDGKDRAPRARLNCRILLAEDGPDNQRLIALMLTRAGAEVTLADNGQVAREQALAARDRGEPFDVILMDMQMPVLDGYEATRRLRTDGYTGLIIALTAHAMAEDRSRCLAAGCNDYLSKPIDRDRLLKKMAGFAQKGTEIVSKTKQS